MPERIGVIPTWAWIVGAILVIGVVLTGYRMIQTQQRLQTVQTDLERAKQGADQARAMTADLEKRTASLNSELENATTQRGDLQTKLDEATLELKSVQSTLESAQSR